MIRIYDGLGDDHNGACSRAVQNQEVRGNASEACRCCAEEVDNAGEGIRAVLPNEPPELEEKHSQCPNKACAESKSHTLSTHLFREPTFAGVIPIHPPTPTHRS